MWNLQPFLPGQPLRSSLDVRQLDQAAGGGAVAAGGSSPSWSHARASAWNTCPLSGGFSRVRVSQIYSTSVRQSAALVEGDGGKTDNSSGLWSLPRSPPRREVQCRCSIRQPLCFLREVQLKYTVFSRGWPLYRDIKQGCELYDGLWIVWSHDDYF